MKRKLLNALLLVGLAAGILLSLNQMTDYPNKHTNGFKRFFNPNTVHKISNATFINNFTGLCGIINNHIYFSNYSPGLITVTDTNLIACDTIRLPLPITNKLASSFYTFVDFPQISILGGNSRIRIAGNLLNGTSSTSLTNTGPFDNVVEIGANQYIMRCIDTITKSTSFKKLTFDGKTEPTDWSPFSKHHDAGFTFDGVLTYNASNNALFYVFHYSNEILCFDSSMNIKFRAHTIDTCRTPQIAIAFTKAAITVKTPPRYVNFGISTCEDVLYIRSALKADNQSNDSFRDNAVIDCYEVETGKYINSFLLPLENNQKLHSFSVFNKNKMIALFENSIILYTLP